MTASVAPRSFDVCGELPTGMTLLQASAGTGKTFTIAALTTRYVAEGILPIDRLLVITFTRMATGELRERVRERLVRAFDGLVDTLEGAGRHEDDEIVQLLAAGPVAEVEARRDRLGKAIADFDAATIETTHGFCLQVLYGLGTAGDIDREVTLVEDVRDLMEEVVDDLYLRKFATRPNPLEFTREDAMEIARFVLAHPDAEVVPPLSQQPDVAAVRRRFAKAVHEEMEERKKARKILTYDDVLSRLRDTLLDDERGPAACARLRERYDVVLVDEFQDTDPVQWDIMHYAFGLGGTTLVLIGDPKQAIYAFRGADVHAYLLAHQEVESEWTLDVNWRSDQGLLEAYDALFAGAQLGYADITYRDIRAAPANQEARLVGAPETAPLRLRILHAADNLVPLTARQRQPKAPDARAAIARDLAADVVGLLTAGPKIVTRRRDGTALECTLHPGHIAVLVRANAHATLVRDALHAAGVRAVIGGAGSVFATEPAQEWLRLLEALERPTARDRASLVALTCFVGWTAEAVATAPEEEWEELHWSLHQWAALLRDQGVASLFETVSSSHAVPGRVLGRPSGERFTTDLRHIAQLLHEAGVSEGLGPTAMATWLGRRIHDAERDAENEERARRLESDAEAVQVITIHRSKGLEFPIVYCPFVWDGRPYKSDVPVFHDPANANRRAIDVGHEGNSFAVHQKMELEEGRGEDLRLLYVALTRARHQAVLWWAGASDSQHSPLARLLFDRGPDGVVPPYGATTRTDAAVVAAAGALGSRVAVERVAPPSAARWQPDTGDPPPLAAARFGRALDTEWRRASYSSITRALHDQPAIGSELEPGLELTSDEEVVMVPVQSGTVDQAEATVQSLSLGLAGMPGGALVGTVVHSVLEGTAFDAPDLAAEVAGALGHEMAWHRVDLGSTDAVVSGLCAAIECPLGALVDDVRLRDVPRRDRLDELTFEIPLVGGEDPAATLRLGAVAGLLEEHLPADDPVARYAERLRDPALGGVLRGYLTGSLDLVFRLPGDRFVLADYKTNRLAGPDETLTAWHYRPEALQAEMVAAHYPLQALLYAVALHRYLRWRLPGYEPDRHLAGVLYLFVRGMSTAEPVRFGEQPCGVWSWRPPAALVESLSELFDRGQP